MTTLISTNPANPTDVLGEVAITRPEELASIVAQAHTAQAEWWQIGLEQRKAYLAQFLETLKQYREELTTLPAREMGAPVSLTGSFIPRSEKTFQWNLDNADKALANEILFEDDKEINELVYEPYGVVAVIVAWNFPYPNFIQSVIPPLLAGNAVVMKYSEEIPMFSKLMEKIIAESGLPKGVVSFVYGDGKVGAALAESDINLISFTGSYTVGQKLYETAAKKFIPIINELGGSSPGIVFADMASKLDAIVPSIFKGRFGNSGQFCSNIKRLLVHRSLFDACVEKLTAAAANAKVGNPLEEDTDMGPLVAPRQVNQIKEQLQDALDKGAICHVGGKQPAGLDGAFFEPTILTNISKDMRVWHEEVFGPILPVTPFDTYEEAIELANDTSYGLNANIFTEDRALAQKAIADLPVGTAAVHGANSQRPSNPSGGYKHSGMGRVKGIRGFHDVAQVKTVARLK